MYLHLHPILHWDAADGSTSHFLEHAKVRGAAVRARRTEVILILLPLLLLFPVSLIPLKQLKLLFHLFDPVFFLFPSIQHPV